MTALPWEPFGAPQPFAGRVATEPCVVVAGVFDGLHVGHRVLVEAAIADARARGVACVALSFDPDPDEVLGTPRPSSRLLRTSDRVAALRSLGVDEVVMLPFTRAFAAQDPKDFARGALAELRPVCVHVGENFRFGHGGAGDPRLLAELGAAGRFEVCAHALVADGGETVSSTRVRRLLHEEAGLAEANRLLCRCHFVHGVVEHGRGEGTSFGFPTANVVCDPLDCMPAEGVYSCYVSSEGSAWPAAANVGAPPTFSASKPAFLEANLIGFEGNLYGSEVTVTFVEWLRPSRVFDSLEELERVVLENIAYVRETLGNGRR